MCVCEASEENVYSFCLHLKRGEYGKSWCVHYSRGREGVGEGVGVSTASGGSSRTTWRNKEKSVTAATTAASESVMPDRHKREESE